MKNLYLSFLLFVLHGSLVAQTVALSGQCITNTITLAKIPDVNGKAAYQGTGTVAGSSGIAVYIYWLPAPDLLWVVDFDGQPFFTSSCNTSLPPATSVSSCPWSAVTGQDCTGGTPLSISGSGTLPVSLTGFAAAKTDQGVQLTWKTATESNNKGFEVQRSTDGNTWVRIGFVKGGVNSSSEKTYSYYDGTPFSGMNYYRLSQIDLDNQQKLSSIVNTLFTASADYFLHTNNTSSGIYRLTVRSADPLELSVFDMSGKKLVQKTVRQGVHELDISGQAPGIYLLQLKGNNKTLTEKLVKK